MGSIPISTSRSSKSFTTWLLYRKQWLLTNHFETLLTKFFQIEDGKINSPSWVRFQFQPLEVQILPQSGSFLEGNQRSKTTLKSFWPNFFKLIVGKINSLSSIRFQFHFEAFLNHPLQVDFTKFAIRISTNSNFESLNFKFSLKAPILSKASHPSTFLESNLAKRILQNSIPNFETE